MAIASCLCENPAMPVCQILHGFHLLEHLRKTNEAFRKGTCEGLTWSWGRLTFGKVRGCGSLIMNYSTVLELAKNCVLVPGYNVQCHLLLIVPEVEGAEQGLPCASTEYCNNGGLLHCSKEHFSFLSKLKNILPSV